MKMGRIVYQLAGRCLPDARWSDSTSTKKIIWMDFSNKVHKVITNLILVKSQKWWNMKLLRKTVLSHHGLKERSYWTIEKYNHTSPEWSERCKASLLMLTLSPPPKISQKYKIRMTRKQTRLYTNVHMHAVRSIFGVSGSRIFRCSTAILTIDITVRMDIMAKSPEYAYMRP